MSKKKGTEIEVREKQEVEQAKGEATWEGRFFVPDVDIMSNDAAITVTADLPGVKREDLEIDLREGVLTIIGRSNGLPDGFQAVRAEYESGGYLRRFTLSDDIDAENIEATLKDGVLTLVLPKAEKALPRKIEVKTG